MDVGVRDLRDNLSRHLRAVLEGTEITVTDHGRAVARIVAVDQPDRFAELVAEGVITPARAGRSSLADKGVSARGTVSDLVAEQRR